MTAGDTVNLNVLFGHSELKRLPIIYTGKLAWEPYEYTRFDGSGQVADHSISLGIRFEWDISWGLPPWLQAKA